LALCDTEVKDKVKALTKYKQLDKILEAMAILKEIKKILVEATTYMPSTIKLWHTSTS